MENCCGLVSRGVTCSDIGFQIITVAARLIRAALKDGQSPLMGCVCVRECVYTIF